MSGERHLSGNYGFTEEVLQYLMGWFVDDACSTPDVWGRKVFHVDSTGAKVQKVVRHMIAGDRYENHDLFVKLRGNECLQLCVKTLQTSGRTMKPRIPGVTVLDSCMPSFVKYFKKSEFGECSICKPAYDNYAVFSRCVREINPDIVLPQTVSLFVGLRVCIQTLGERRHECEENRCRQCSFVNFFIRDPTLTKAKSSSYGSLTTFSEDYKIEFLLDSVVVWTEYEQV